MAERTRALGVIRVWGVLAVLALGCVEDSDGDPPRDAAPADVGLLVDLGGVDSGDGGMPDRALPIDAGETVDIGEPDAADMMGDMRPDMAQQREIDTCEQACGRYAECDRIGEDFADYEACLSDCGRIARTGRPDEWFDCIELEQCNLLRLCPVPEVQPLDCAEVCGLVDTCEVGLALPDCEATCEAKPDTFRPCGDALYDGCDTEGFADCVVSQVFPECRSTCDTGVACNLVRDGECIDTCLSARLSGDPLAGLRSSQLAQCTDGAQGDCERIDACFFPPEPGEAPDVAGFCADYAACGLGEFFTCNDVIAQIGEAGIPCAQGILDGNCPGADVFIEFEITDICFGGGGINPRQVACTRLCEARDVCGLLDAGQQRLGCITACVGQGVADPDEAERADAALPCGGAESCDALVSCIEGSGPGVECEALCGALAACGAGGDGCRADCEARWPRDRHAAYRGCVRDAGDDCASVTACAVPPGPPCDAYCAGLAECGVATPGCAGACDDDHFADPASALAEVACVLTARACDGRDDPHAVLTCNGQSEAGKLCLGFCRAETECVGDAAGLADCLVACGDGLAGDAGLRFEAGRDCIDGLPIDAACDALTGCVPPDADADCAALCAQADGCGIALAECPDRCADDPLARLRALRAEACIRPGDDCATVEACVLPALFDPGLAPVAPVLDEAGWCAIYNGCPDAPAFFGPCAGEFDFIEPEFGTDGLTCTADALSRCDDFWIDDYFDCFNEPGGGRPPNPLADACGVLCEARRYCDPDGPPQRDCEVACEALFDPADPDSQTRAAPQLWCGAVWSCRELETCEPASTPAALCATQCAQRIACGEVLDRLDCEAACDRDFGRTREVQRRACLAGVADDDCAAIAACAPPPPLPCDLACATLAGCGLAPARCVETCDDAGALDPAGEAQRIACLVAAGDDCDAVAQCQIDPGQGGGACFAFCRATTECSDAPDEDLPTCLTRCLTGFGDEDALLFAAAEECLGAAAGADCDALLACVPDAPAVDCAAFCGALEGCRVPGDDCVAACEAAPDADAAICVSDALRTGGRCAGVAACVGYMPPAADPECRALCDVVTGCDRGVDPYLCRADCTPSPAALPFQLACAELSSCDAALDVCTALDAEVTAACVDVCVDAVACGQFADAASCEATCTGRDASDRTPDAYLDRVAACFDDATAAGGCDADAAARCFEPASCDLRDDLIHFDGDAGAVEFDIAGLPDLYGGTCGASAGPEAIIVVNVDVPSVLTAFIVEANYDTLLYLRGDCDGAELICNDDWFDVPADEPLWSSLQLPVEPGTYYLFVEGYSGDVGQGAVQIDVEPR